MAESHHHDQPVASFNLTKRQCTLKSGDVVPITRLFGHFGEDLADFENSDEVCSFVAGQGDYWVAVWVDQFEPVTLQ